MTGLYILLGLLLAVIFGVAFFKFRRRPPYGKVVDKRVVLGVWLRSADWISRANLIAMPSEGMVPNRHQLCLKRKGKRAVWIDVAEDQYHQAEKGQFWAPY